MTLIASFEVEGAPIVLGDMLVSSPGDQERELSFPLFQGNISPLRGNTFLPSGLTQKVVIIHPHVCVAWSGPLIVAYGFLRHLRSFTRDADRINYDDLQSHIDHFPIDDLRQLGVTVHSWHAPGWGFYSTLAKFDIGPLSNVRVAGSGTEHFVSNIEHVCAGAIKGQLFPYATGVMRARAYAALASAEQFFRGTGVADCWGGGFELAVFDGSRFQKERALHLYWVFQDIGDSRFVLQLLPAFMYQFYVDGISYFWIDEGKGGISRLHSVGPPFEPYTASDSKPPDFSTNVVICCVRYVSSDTVKHAVYIDYTQDGHEPVLTLTSDERDTFFSAKNEFFERLLRELGLPNPAAIDVWGHLSRLPDLDHRLTASADRFR